MEDLTIVITGDRKGIGKDLTKYYLAKGCNVIGCSRIETDFSDDNYSHYCLSVSNESSVKKMFSEIQKDFGCIDVLINNAGVSCMNHSFLMPLATAKNILETNVLGTFLCSRECAKIMMKSKRGKIINFASFAVPFKLEGEAMYAASKAAIISLTEILSKEYAAYNITVNAVAPAATKTDLIKNVPKEIMDDLLKRQTIHRYSTTMEIAKVIDFFIYNDIITGQTVYMGGI